MQQQKDKSILNIKELSEYLGCVVSTIYKLIYNNDIPYFRIYSSYHFDLNLINRWIINRHNNLEIGGF